jgi:hypothetical protein
MTLRRPSGGRGKPAHQVFGEGGRLERNPPSAGSGGGSRFILLGFYLVWRLGFRLVWRRD